MRKIIFCVLGMSMAISCTKNNKLPKEKYYQFSFTASYSYKNDTLKVEVKNPLNCPLRISLSSPDKNLLDVVAKFDTLTLKERSDTLINYYLKDGKKIILHFNSIVGDVNKEIIKEKFSLPFPEKPVV